MLNLFSVNNKVTRTGLNDVFLMSLLLTLNRFITKFGGTNLVFLYDFVTEYCPPPPLGREKKLLKVKVKRRQTNDLARSILRLWAC